MVDEESKDAKKAQQAQALKSSGLDSLLSEYDTKKKVSVIDKSRMDWDSFKKVSGAAHRVCVLPPHDSARMIH